MSRLGYREARIDTNSKDTKSFPENSIRGRLPDKIIVIGGCEGGLSALQAVLCGLDPLSFSVVAGVELKEPFARKAMAGLAAATGFRVTQAETGSTIVTGAVLLRPPGCDLSFKGSRNAPICQIRQRDRLSNHPSANDTLFLSAAEVMGCKAMGILLLEADKGGSHGLIAMQQYHCLTAREVELHRDMREACIASIQRICEAEAVPLAGLAQWIREAAAERPIPPPEQAWSERTVVRATRALAHEPHERSNFRP